MYPHPDQVSEEVPLLFESLIVSGGSPPLVVGIGWCPAGEMVEFIQRSIFIRQEGWICGDVGYDREKLYISGLLPGSGNREMASSTRLDSSFVSLLDALTSYTRR